MVQVNDKLALKFFKLLKEDYEMGCLSREANAMIQKEPKLLECKCPETANDDDDEEEGAEEDLEEWTGRTATECMCVQESISPYGRDTLLVLVEAGAVATEKCYELALYDDEVMSDDYLIVLLASGFMPLKLRGQFLLDAMVQGCDDDPSEILGDCMKILHRRVQVGDQFGFGKITEYLVKNIGNLPILEVGVTHKEGGPFAECQEQWLKENSDKEETSEEKKEEDEDDEKHTSKKQRR